MKLVLWRDDYLLMRDMETGTHHPLRGIFMSLKHLEWWLDENVKRFETKEVTVEIEEQDEEEQCS